MWCKDQLIPAVGRWADPALTMRIMLSNADEPIAWAVFRGSTKKLEKLSLPELFYIVDEGLPISHQSNPPSAS